MIIYLTVSLLAVAGSVFIFFDHLMITNISLLPLGLSALSVLQVIIFLLLSREPSDHTNETSYSMRETDHKAEQFALKYHALSKLAILPVLCIFIFYFGTAWKIAIPLIVYFLSFVPPRLFVNRKKGD